MPNPSTLAMDQEQILDSDPSTIDPSALSEASVTDHRRRAVIIKELLKAQHDAEDQGNHHRSRCLMDARVDLTWGWRALDLFERTEAHVQRTKSLLEGAKAKLASQAIRLQELDSLKRSLALLGKDLLEMQASRDRVLAENCTMTQEIRDLRAKLKSMEPMSKVELDLALNAREM